MRDDIKKLSTLIKPPKIRNLQASGFALPGFDASDRYANKMRIDQKNIKIPISKFTDFRLINIIPIKPVATNSGSMPPDRPETNDGNEIDTQIAEKYSQGAFSLRNCATCILVKLSKILQVLESH